MVRMNNQKVKLVCLLDILQKDSDEKNPITTNELCEMLLDRGIHCDRRTLYKDIQVLTDMDFEVIKVTKGKSNAYYMGDNTFSLPELRIIVDALQAASFITEKKTKELIDKIVVLNGPTKAAMLMKNMVTFNKRKHTNENVYYNVFTIEDALVNHKKVSFVYYDLNEKHEKVYRKNQERYIVDPITLVFNEDNYYLMTYSTKYNDIVNYRIDRMEKVEIELDDVCAEALQRSNISKYTEEVFKMYGGKQERVTIEFDQSLIGAVYDKFGENTKMLRLNDQLVRATLDIQVSPTFFGWLFQFAGNMRIIDPVQLQKEYIHRMANAR